MSSLIDLYIWASFFIYITTAFTNICRLVQSFVIRSNTVAGSWWSCKFTVKRNLLKLSVGDACKMNINCYYRYILEEYRHFRAKHTSKFLLFHDELYNGLLEAQGAGEPHTGDTQKNLKREKKEGRNNQRSPSLEKTWKIMILAVFSLWRSSCASFTSFPLSFGDNTHKNPKVEKKTHEVTTN